VELSVSVSDTGIGIPKNALKRIFDLFETVTGDAALANPSLGISSASGIGLTICKELVNAMGGSLSVQSAVGTGSTFVFRLQTLVRAASCAPHAAHRDLRAACCALRAAARGASFWRLCVCPAGRPPI
jgi:K+-sensing histidine kinase KdpD